MLYETIISDKNIIRRFSEGISVNHEKCHRQIQSLKIYVAQMH